MAFNGGRKAKKRKSAAVERTGARGPGVDDAVEREYMGAQGPGAGAVEHGRNVIGRNETGNQVLT